MYLCEMAGAKQHIHKKKKLSVLLEKDSVIKVLNIIINRAM